ncbi:Clp protease ClpP [Corynebacterium mastitidis]|nr:head maturation protease, ClpP-related [Corynebacterium mastitidis]MCH6197454.1 Clp protease ClpP [Corynebacterium mastitidis]
MRRLNRVGDRLELRIYEEIGPSGVTAKAIAEELGDATGDLVVRINSPGGDVFDGLAIMNSLRDHEGEVTAIVEGLAASAASFIAVGGAHRVVMRPGTEMMIHEAWGMSMGNAEDMEAMRLQLDRTSASLAEIYAKKSEGDADRWRELMRKETWFTADEAVAFGLVDAVEDARDPTVSPAPAAFALLRRFNYASREAAPAPYAQTREVKEGTPMTFTNEVARRLGLTGTEDETTVLAALEETLNEQADTDTTMDSPEAPPADTEPDTEATEESEDAEEGSEDDEPAATVVRLDRAVYEDLLERAARGDAADEATAHDRAVALITNEGIKAGRLLGWQRDQWVKAATENYEATKTELMALAPGRISLKEKGYSGTSQQKDEQRSSLAAKARKAGFAPRPVL